MLTHICGRCGFRSNSFIEWSNHLLETPHQTDTRTSFLRWSQDDDERSLVVYAHREDSPMDILEKFRELSVDFVFWTNVPGLFIVQVGIREDADILLTNVRQNPEEMKIGGRDIQLRRKSDVSQNEWIILVGDGTTREGSSREPVCILLSDDDNDDHWMGAVEEQDTAELALPDSNNQVKVKQERNSKSRSSNKSLNETNDNTNGTTAPAPENTIEDICIKTKMNESFSKAFLSKIKSEKTDSKSNVKENLLAMNKEWAKMYVDFHNLMWAVCFLMANSRVTLELNSDSVKSKFTCECLASEKNEWLKVKEKLSADKVDEFVDDKVIEFYRIIKSEAKLVQRFKTLAKCSMNANNKPLLKFDCCVSVKFNEQGAKANFKISKMKGKNLKRKMKLVTKIFTDLFAKYESLKIKELNESDGSSTYKNKMSVKTENWTKIRVE